MSRETPRKRRRSSRRRRHSSRGRRHYSRRRGYALENPLSGMELAVGALTGVVGFIAADALDRVLATHALQDKGATGTDGKELWMDTPSSTGSYAGLFNATAILAPMDWKRWLAGAGITAVPFIIAAFIKSPVGRSSLQFFGFGAGVRILGKAATDLMAKLTGRTSWGARLYDAEARAAALKAGQGAEANLPSAGLGAIGTGVAGCGCQNCTTGVGACCRLTGSQALPPPAGVPQAPAQPPNPVQPSPNAPPQAFQPPAQLAPAPVPAPPAVTPTPALPVLSRTPVSTGMPIGTVQQPPMQQQPRSFAGAPAGVGSVPRPSFSWGNQQETDHAAE